MKKRFNINDFIKWQYKLITIDFLINSYDLSKDAAKQILIKLKKEWIIIKIRKGVYIFKHILNQINSHTMTMLLNPNSYISLYTVLERKVIKQAHVRTFALTNKMIKNNKELIEHYRIELKQIKIPMTFWLKVQNWVRYADTERALLDLIYLHVFNWYPITSELYLKWNIDEEKIKKYLEFYPKRVSNFYFNKLQEYAKQ